MQDDNCIHGLFFIWDQIIQKDEKGYYRLWACAKCGAKFKNRNLDHDLKFDKEI
jgi:hypothetical protein